MELNNMKFNQLNDEETSYQLELLKKNLAGPAYPGYPAFEDRLMIKPDEIEFTAFGELILPDGPWTVNTHPNRHDSESRPDSTKQRELIEQGYSMDSAGRPLHPWTLDMIQDPSIGVVTGKGAYWGWGPNYTVDPIIIHQEHVLLVKRRDTGNWALPGGFIDHGETALEAGPREVREETSIALVDNITPIEVYSGPVADIRVTANAWAETTALLYNVTNLFGIEGIPIGGDDAAEAAWVPLRLVLNDEYLFGSHRYLLNKAIEQL